MFKGQFLERVPNGEQSSLAFFLEQVCSLSPPHRALSFKLPRRCLLGTRAALSRTGLDTGDIKMNENPFDLQSGKGHTKAVLAFGVQFCELPQNSSLEKPGDGGVAYLG